MNFIECKLYFPKVEFLKAELGQTFLNILSLSLHTKYWKSFSSKTEISLYWELQTLLNSPLRCSKHDSPETNGSNILKKSEWWKKVIFLKLLKNETITWPTNKRSSKPLKKFFYYGTLQTHTRREHSTINPYVPVTSL